jgi:hypothetical protein
MEIIIYAILIGYSIGAIIGYVLDKRSKSPKYGIDGKALVEKEMTEKYGDEWINLGKPMKDDFWVECNVCKQQLKNWTGSTPCCGSIAWVIEDGNVTNKTNLTRLDI